MEAFKPLRLRSQSFKLGRVGALVDFDQLQDDHIGVNLRRLKLGVAEQLLDKGKRLRIRIYDFLDWCLTPFRFSVKAELRSPQL
ncbi:MAG: hypothetical protein ACLFU4_06605 [Opitutales bacterium]